MAGVHQRPTFLDLLLKADTIAMFVWSWPSCLFYYFSYHICSTSSSYRNRGAPEDHSDSIMGCRAYTSGAMHGEAREKTAVHRALPSAPHCAVLFSSVFHFLNFLSPSFLSIFRHKVLLNIAQAVPLSP